ncbi:MAG TPA: PQQ-dependent sugar dehydrogenase [Kofleriaceae bacterium]|nr:PQQ-dependent sugar dehydrogenase [Kofleriaceae bacterium]
MSIPHRLAALALMLSLAACSVEGGAPDEAGEGGGGGKADDLACSATTQMVALERGLSGLSFTEPVDMVQAPGSDRWYLVEKRGVVWTFEASADGGEALSPTLFADVRSRVNAGPQEAGLLGLAFSPSFATDGRVYLSYTAPSSASPVNLRSRVSRARSTDGGLTLDLAGEEILLAIDQPFENHNGGHIAFGPDGLLYVGFGDGGSAGDPGNRAQNTSSAFGKLLRVDVSGATGYAVPSDNPFAGGGGLGEIYATGLRNPWRFSFDAPTGRLWLGDVGQNAFEEVDLVVKGGNYGWRRREGAHCFNPSSGCGSFVDPVAEYGRTDGISITGGFVYRGARVPTLAGQYLFGDFGSGRLWTLRETSSGSFERRLVADTELNVSSFAQSHDGELFALDFASGGVFRITAAPCGGSTPDTVDAGAGPTGDVTFRSVYQQILVPRCGPCHTAQSFGGLGMPSATTAFDRLVDKSASSPACSGRTRVEPGQSADSVLFQKVSGQNLCGSLMPPGGQLSAAEVEFIQAWIDEGAAF